MTRSTTPHLAAAIGNHATAMPPPRPSPGGKRGLRRLAAAVLLLAGAGSASAVALMDQIGPDASFQEGRSHNVNQISNFYASAPQYDVAVIDDFTLADEAVIGSVSAALFASDNDTGYSALTGLRVNIFSSRPAPSALYAGDVLTTTVATASVVFTAPWTSNPLSRLAVIDLSAHDLHLAAGTYWLSVVAINNSFYTDIGVFTSSFAGAIDNCNNARRISSTGLWPGGRDFALNADAAYRIDGSYVHAVPEPGTCALLAGGLLLVVGAARRGRL
ncbi:MAG TPA: hypothetical protein PL196_02940 [Burkholderiaceae bacterium]|nr:hypothetical protein [Burkholderiaceae bacterium]